MTAIFFLFVGGGAIVFQTILSEYFFTWTSARPDAMLLITLYIAIRRGNESGLVTGFVMGLLQDILAGGMLGANSLSKGLLGYLTDRLVRNVVGRNWFLMMTLGFFATAFDLVLWALLSLIFQPEIGISTDYWYTSLKTIAMNALLAPIFIHLLSGIEDKIVPQSIGVPYTNRF